MHAASENPAPEIPFPETADIETSSAEYAGRFAGPPGKWMLEVQQRICLGFLPPSGENISVLDVGGGHGQLARPLCEKGFRVTVAGSHPSCSARIEDLIEAGRLDFAVANLIDLPFPNASFDAVIAFRLLTHCDRLQELIHELCRVARRSIVVDYPTRQSLNAVAPMLFKAKKRIEHNTRPWRLFRHAEIIDAFQRAGWRLEERQAQFFFPMVLHRALHSRRLSMALEAVGSKSGLTSRWGSPVIARLIPAQSPS